MKAYFTNQLLGLLLIFLITSWQQNFGQWIKHPVDENIKDPSGLYLADIDGDSDLDVTATDYLADLVVWYENDGGCPIKWIPYTIDNTLTSPHLMDNVADIDGDLDIDLVVPGYKSNNVVWYENKGGTPVTWTRYTIGGGLAGAAFVNIFDMDNDTDMDVIVTGFQKKYVVWFENTGGNPIDWILHTVDDNLTGTHHTFAGDIDGDEDMDIAVAAAMAGVVVWYENDSGNVNWIKHTIDNNIAGANHICIADINGDENLDIVANANNGADVVVWYENNGEIPISWSKHKIGDHIAAFGMKSSDIDDDKDLDIVTAGSGKIVWYENNGEIPITWNEHIIGSLKGAKNIAVGDVDDDGDPDVFTNSQDEHVIVFYENLVNSVYGLSVDIYPGYLLPEGDTLIVNSKLYNPENHSLEVFAKISGSEETYQDSIELFDDGLHNDGEFGDNNWGGSKILSSLEEDYFEVIIKTTDLDENIVTILPSGNYFTTIGPIVLQAIEEEFKYERQYFQLTYENKGFQTTADNLKIKINTTDPRVKAKVFAVKSIPDIAAGNIDTTDFSYYFYYEEGYDTNSTIGDPIIFDYEVSSDGKVYWTGIFAFEVDSISTNIDEKAEILPSEFMLEQNYPNPFNPSTTIKYSLPAGRQEFQTVKLKVYDVLGREVATLVNRNQNSGNYEVEWNASEFPSGIYFYQLKASDFIETKKMILIK